MESIDDVVNKAVKSAANLNKCQREILALIAEGRSNRQISERLARKEKTVETYVGRITAAIGANGRFLSAVAVRYVILQNMEYNPPFKLEELQLTPRLTEILFLAGAGMVNREIAAELGIATKTVEKQITSLKDAFEIEREIERAPNRLFWAYAAWYAARPYADWCANRPKIA